MKPKLPLLGLMMSLCLRCYTCDRNAEENQDNTALSSRPIPVYDGVITLNSTRVYKTGIAIDIPLQNSCLHAHNLMRENHAAPPLEWDEQLSRSAQVWAAEMAKERKPHHSSPSARKLNGKPVGENYYFHCISLRMFYQPEFLMYPWYKEFVDGKYNFADPEDLGNFAANHFTQIVWKYSKKLGCGEAMTKINKVYCSYLVCHYYPAGNYMHSFGENVHNLLDDKPLYMNGSQLLMEDCSDSTRLCATSWMKKYCTYKLVEEICCDSCFNN